MADSFTETSYQGWGSRVGNSIKGVFVGGIMLVAAFPLLFLNEGCAVKDHRTLTEGAGSVVPGVSVDKVDPANDKKFVHMTGPVKGETLSDTEFGVSADAIKLRRTVEMYQWEEEKESKTKKKLGGGEETVTTYSYKKVWEDHAIDSSNFNERGRDEHQNPPEMQYQGQSLNAERVTLGVFTLSNGLVSQLNDYSPLPVSAKAPAASKVAVSESAADEDAEKSDEKKTDVPVEAPENAPPTAGAANMKVDNGRYYFGSDPSNPKVGDLRVSFQVVKPAVYSILSRQTGETFEPFVASTGGQIERATLGTLSAQQMLEQAHGEVTMRTWLIRAGGFMMMFFGMMMIVGPLAVVGDVVPFIGSLLRLGTGLISGLLAAVFSLVTISIAWIVYRPVIGIALLLVAVGLIVAAKMLAKNKAKPSTV